MEGNCYARPWSSDANCPVNAGDTGAGAVLFTSLLATLMQSQNQLGNPYDYPKDATLHLLGEYDFVVVGAGSAGSVVASRLSEVAGWKVLLLEAGGDPPLTSDVPRLAPTLEKTSIDWQFKTEPQIGVCQGLINKQCSWPRGKVIGGTSTINYFLYVRGMKDDYDEWAKAGNKGWSYEEVLPYFKKSEDADNNKLLEMNSDGFFYHAKGGPLTIESLDETDDLVPTLLEATKEMGYEELIDINGINQHGFSRLFCTITNGTRCSAAKAFLNQAKDRENLHVAKHVHVTRILIDYKTKSATGVEFVTQYGKKYKIKFRKEVIVSAGTVNSPQILMLSGIGPAEHLKEIGIKLVNDLKVGENLQDHFTVSASLCNMKISSLIKKTPKFLLDASYEYIVHRTGFLRTHPFSTLTGFIKTESSPEEERPNLQYHFNSIGSKDLEEAEAFARSFGFTNETENSLKELVDKSDVLMFLPTLSRPKSRGKILLKSSDPMAYPKIYPGYLSDPERRDVATMIDGIRFTQKLMQTKAMKRRKARKAKLYIKECESLEFDSDDYWECVLRQVGTTLFHPAGSCKMGPSSDPDAVVNPELRVHGVKGIRVADASIMPTIASGNLNAPCIMIGEKGCGPHQETLDSVINQLKSQVDEDAK